MKKITCCIFAVLLIFSLRSAAVYAKEPVVVVIDPGHGGENLGAEYGAYTEKNMTMITAAAMKEELEKYEGITVYMTRETDKDMTLKERVGFAQSVNADFFFCLHYNMSVNHNLFGAEVWVSAFDSKYQKGSAFARIEIDMLKELGLYSRGIKTKLNDQGKDYYGIIRHAAEADMAAVIIEHCHLDQDNDKEFYTTEEKLKQFGRLDATAVAKYYGLKSEALKTDFSNFPKQEVPVPDTPVKPDKTPPDVCTIKITDVEEQTGTVSVELSAQDYDSYMLYYSYSHDGGQSFSDLQKWDTDSDTVSFTLTVPSGKKPEIVVNAYNGFDGFTTSNTVSLPLISYGQDAVEASSTITPDSVKDKENSLQIEEDTAKEDEKKETDFFYLLQVSFICIAILVLLIWLARIVTAGYLKKKRGRRK